MARIFRPVIHRGLRIAYHLLYHQLAWSYDYVAWTVSLGQWNNWVYSVEKFLDIKNGGYVLELGHGPGHLQSRLGKQGMWSVGLDASFQMNQHARRLLRRNTLEPRLVNGVAERLPFASGSFEQVVATFPSEYILFRETLSETYRVLKPQGSLLIVPFAWVTGKSWRERFTAWLSEFTGQAPTLHKSEIESAVMKMFNNTDFRVNMEYVELDNSVVFIIQAIKN